VLKQVLRPSRRDAQAGAQTVACNDATLSHQEKKIRQMSTSGARTFFSWCGSVASPDASV
jgi:hypothetical protein